jgi:hypothetical protein
MDIDRLRQFLLQPQESAKLDFKIELYKINEPKPTVPADIQRWAEAREQQWAELTKDILADLILADATVTLEQLLQFLLDTDEAIFMFDREVSDYLQTLYKNAAKLYSTNKRLANSNLPIGEARSKLEEENSELLIWFTEQIEIVRNLFYKYIYL